jgi:hypothetical protein
MILVFFSFISKKELRHVCVEGGGYVFISKKELRHVYMESGGYVFISNITRT